MNHLKWIIPAVVFIALAIGWQTFRGQMFPPTMRTVWEVDAKHVYDYSFDNASGKSLFAVLTVDDKHGLIDENGVLLFETQTTADVIDQVCFTRTAVAICLTKNGLDRLYVYDFVGTLLYEQRLDARLYIPIAGPDDSIYLSSVSKNYIRVYSSDGNLISRGKADHRIMEIDVVLPDGTFLARTSKQGLCQYSREGEMLGCLIPTNEIVVGPPSLNGDQVLQSIGMNQFGAVNLDGTNPWSNKISVVGEPVPQNFCVAIDYAKNGDVCYAHGNQLKCVDANGTDKWQTEIWGKIYWLTATDNCFYVLALGIPSMASSSKDLNTDDEWLEFYQNAKSYLVKVELDGRVSHRWSFTDGCYGNYGPDSNGRFYFQSNTASPKLGCVAIR